MRPTKKSGEILKKFVEIAKKLKKLPTSIKFEEYFSERQVRKHFGTFTNLTELALKTHPELKKVTLQRIPRPKVLLFDIETKPILAYLWDIWNQNVALNQIKEDWSVLSCSAKWLDSPEIMYRDNRNNPDLLDDKDLLIWMRNLLDEADIVITQNGIRFDQPKLFARFKKHKIRLPSSFKHIDTCRIASRYFAFTSNKLEHLCEVLGVKHKKLKHKKFPGFDLWKECMANNPEAWQEMELYNKHDVLALEECFWELQDVDQSVNFNLYHDEETHLCRCGSTESIKLPTFYYTTTGKYHKYQCVKCGAETRDNTNLLSIEKRRALRRGTVR